jgi:SHS2 domain-containing protein
MMTAWTSDEKWRLLEHTADIRMEVYGKDLRELFVNAATGLTQLLRPEGGTIASHLGEVVLESTDAEALLVDWLREVLFCHEVRDLIFLGAETLELRPEKLAARVTWGLRPPDSELATEIKGVTYHCLSIAKRGDGYVAQVIFDI